MVHGLPRGKGRARITTRGGFPRAYTDEKTREYEHRIAEAAAKAGAVPSTCPCTVSLIAVFPIPASWPKKRKTNAVEGNERHTTKPDADNLLKSLDGLNGIAWKDDSQVYEATVKKVYGLNPHIWVCVQYDEV
jgi:Holliday junction resolvase RusA-like endonuclease